MNRAYLCSAIEGLVSECGYNFTLDDKSHYPTTVCRYPAAFMSQPKFLRIEGEKHGRITYDVSLTLARQGAKLSPVERNRVLAEMEQQIVEIFTNLSKTAVVALIDNLTIFSVEGVIDSHGALAMEAQAEIETIF